MVLKIFKAVWFLSLLATMAVFMYIYASLPESVALTGDAAGVSTSREVVFYVMVGLLGLFNAMVFVFTRLSARDEGFLIWFFGLIICFNLFFMLLMYIINLMNSGERFDYGRLDFVIYGTVGLLALWTVSWPIITVTRKILAKA